MMEKPLRCKTYPLNPRLYLQVLFCAICQIKHASSAGPPPEANHARVTSGALSADHVTAKLLNELQRYEQKYGMRSEICYTLIAGTPAVDHPDFLQWAMCYRSYFRALQDKFPFKELAVYAV